MRGMHLIALVSLMLLVFQPALGAPSAPVIGMLNGTGTIRLNGLAVPSGTALYAGNRIATGSQADADIPLEQGGKLVLGESTSMRITEGKSGLLVELDHGVVGVVSTTNAPVAVEANGVTVRPRHSSGAYEVALSGETLRVLARHGIALAEASNRTVEVPEGKVMQGTTKHPVPAGVGANLTGKGTLILVTLVAAGITGVGLGTALSAPSRGCVSQSGLTCP